MFMSVLAWILEENLPVTEETEPSKPKEILSVIIASVSRLNSEAKKTKYFLALSFLLLNRNRDID